MEHEIPNDINGLRALVFQQAAEIEQLKSQLAELRRLHFGRRSEKIERQTLRLENKLSELEEEQIQALALFDAAVPPALRQSPVRAC